MRKFRVHQGDLPNLQHYGAVSAVAIDTETLGLNLQRDRLCLVQLSSGDDTADLVQISVGQTEAPNLTRLLKNPEITKIFHYARFDMAMLEKAFGEKVSNVYCTKIASKLVRTYTDKHGLKDLCADLLGVNLSKQSQCSDWAAPVLTDAQIAYAASDVLYLHKLRTQLDARLARESRTSLAQACFDFLPTRVALDLAGWENQDIFAHS